jgi:hypothetical protein
MKQSNDSTCKRAATSEKNVSCHACPSSCSIDHAWQPQKNSKWLYMSHFPNIKERCQNVDLWTIIWFELFFHDKQSKK